MRHILIADDHELVRRGLHRVIQDAFSDVSVQEVASAIELLEQVPTRQWDLILIDIMMPGGGVYPALRQIRKTHPTVPVLIVTAHTESDYVLKAIKSGANGVVHKHRTNHELVEAIRHVLGGNMYLHPETVSKLNLLDSDQQQPHLTLSEREQEVFHLIAQGQSIKDIANNLQISNKTVETYIARIREKTGLGSYVEIARYALQHKLET